MYKDCTVLLPGTEKTTLAYCTSVEGANIVCEGIGPVAPPGMIFRAGKWLDN